MKNYYYQPGTVVTFIYSIIFTMIVLTTLIPSTVGAVTECRWQVSPEVTQGDYHEVRFCNSVAPGKTACDGPPNADCGSVAFFPSLACPTSAGNLSSENNGITCRITSTQTVSQPPLPFTPESGACYAKKLRTACTVDTPTNLKGTAGGCGSGEMILSWNASGVSGVEYEGYRADVGTVAQLGTATSFGDTGLIAGASYTYYLRAKYRGAVSSYTSVTVTAPPVCPAASVNLNFI